jgi:hypothetical protein
VSNITERIRQKYAVTLSVVFVTARFRIVLNVFVEKWSEAKRFRQKMVRFWRERSAKLSVFGSVQHIQRRSQILRLLQIRRVKLSNQKCGVKNSAFRHNTVFAKVRSCRRIQNIFTNFLNILALSIFYCVYL